MEFIQHEYKILNSNVHCQLERAMGTIESHEKDPVNIMANVAGLRISWNENNTCLGYADRIEYRAGQTKFSILDPDLDTLETNS